MLLLVLFTLCSAYLIRGNNGGYDVSADQNQNARVGRSFSFPANRFAQSSGRGGGGWSLSRRNQVFPEDRFAQGPRSWSRGQDHGGYGRGRPEKSGSFAGQPWSIGSAPTTDAPAPASPRREKSSSWYNTDGSERSAYARRKYVEGKLDARRIFMGKRQSNEYFSDEDNVSYKQGRAAYQAPVHQPGTPEFTKSTQYCCTRRDGGMVYTAPCNDSCWGSAYGCGHTYC